MVTMTETNILKVNEPKRTKIRNTVKKTKIRIKIPKNSILTEFVLQFTVS